ncbi:MAG: hypothetical protein ACREQ5_29410 [Candidatus Dormibacteria bacterium]
MRTDTMNQVNDDAGWAPSYLRRLLLEVGVGSRVSIRELARQSGRRLNREWVRLLLQPIPAGQRGTRYDYEDIEVLAEVLRRLNVPVTARQLDRAVMADLGFPSAVSDHAATSGTGNRLDEILTMIEQLTDADRRRLLVRLSVLLAPGEEAAVPSARGA